jgi:hypothetical protein
MNVVWLECDWSGLKVRHKRSIGSPSLPSAYEWQIGVFQKRFEFVSARKSGPFAEVKWDHPPPVVTMRDEQRGFRCLGGEDRAVCWLLIQIPVYRPAAYGGGEREGGERRVAGVTTVDLEGHGEQGRRKGDAEQVGRGKTSIVQTAEEQQDGCMVLASEGGLTRNNIPDRPTLDGPLLTAVGRLPHPVRLSLVGGLSKEVCLR